jgi:hypothetical protein
MTRILTEAHTYATAESAEKSIIKIMSEGNVSWAYVIVAQPNGRFTALCINRGDAGELQMMINLMHKSNYKFAVAG